MNVGTLKRAMDEARRFLEAAKKAQEKNESWGCKENGAAKRASMDLTRALAEMRKSN